MKMSQKISADNDEKDENLLKYFFAQYSYNLTMIFSYEVPIQKVIGHLI